VGVDLGAAIFCFEALGCCRSASHFPCPPDPPQLRPGLQFPLGLQEGTSMDLAHRGRYRRDVHRRGRWSTMPGGRIWGSPKVLTTARATLAEVCTFPPCRWPCKAHAVCAGRLSACWAARRRTVGHQCHPRGEGPPARALGGPRRGFGDVLETAALGAPGDLYDLFPGCAGGADPAPAAASRSASAWVRMERSWSPLGRSRDRTL